ncbi:hypothetical protein BDR06DRAFT_1056245 [Suillus hirtellus]|nr:hypothetical protein BDR06DRAFT_1056245 [Suillus hirtellus]
MRFQLFLPISSFLFSTTTPTISTRTATMDDAWQSQDIAPSGISIPTHEANMNGGPAGREEQNWNGSARSPGRDRGGEPPRRSSRSRSPVRDDRG